MVRQGTVVVAQNDAVKISTALCLRSGASVLGISVPAIDAGIAYVLGSGDGVTYSRVQIVNPTDGTSLELSLDSGKDPSSWIIGAFPYRWLKIELATTQTTAAVSFVINWLE